MPLLEARNLSFAYRAEPVVRDVSLSVNAGELLCLLGPNGSGKSTLLKLLIHHLRGSGEVLWEGKPISHWTPRGLARLVSYLAQSPSALPEATVHETLQQGRTAYQGWFGLESQHDAELIQQIAAQLGLTDLLKRPLHTLSGGQRQRVFVGRCLAQQPKVLLLDEPDTFLDLKAQQELLELLNRLRREQNLAIIVATHNVSLAAMHADRMVVMSAGEIEAIGARISPDVLTNVYGVPIVAVNSLSGRTHYVVE